MKTLYRLVLISFMGIAWLGCGDIKPQVTVDNVVVEFPIDETNCGDIELAYALCVEKGYIIIGAGEGEAPADAVNNQ